MLVLFGLMYRNTASLRTSFDTTAAGILIGAALFFSCLGGTVSLIVAERERRTLRRLLVSPLHPVAYFLGLVLALSVSSVSPWSKRIWKSSSLILSFSTVAARQLHTL